MSLLRTVLGAIVIVGAGISLVPRPGVSIPYSLPQIVREAPRLPNYSEQFVAGDISTQQQIILELAGTNPALAFELINSHATAEVRERLQALAYEAWSKSNPASAANWILNLDGTEQAAALRSILTQWTAKDPEAAAKFVSMLPQARQTLVTYWAQNDFPSALRWIQSLALAEQPELLFTIRWEWATADPPAAAAYALAVADQTRDEWLRVVANEWSRKNSTTAFTPIDSAAARAWAEGLPDAGSP